MPRTTLFIISAAIANEHHIIQLDRASAHIAKGVHPPKNVVLLFQPSHAPELNPIERLWEHLKDSLSWQLFEDLDELRHLVREGCGQKRLVKHTSRQRQQL